MKKIALLAGAVVCAAGFATAAETKAPAPVKAAAPALKWVAARGTVSQADGIYSIKSNGMQGGIKAQVRGVPKRRFTVKAEVRGEGRLMLAVSGDFGWRYGDTVALNSEWQPLEISYGTILGNADVSFLSMTKAATAFDVRNVEFTVAPPAELTADDIEAKLLPALEYPGGNARKYKDCVWGKRWYQLMLLPVPANSKGLYYYIHIKSAKGIIKQLYLHDKGQRICKFAACPDSDGKYAWVKLGPIDAVIAPESIALAFNGNAAIEAWVDKAVLSTNPDLTEEQLNKAE